MQFPSRARPPLGVVYDAALGNGIEEALALAMLYGFQGKGECRVISVSTSRSSLKSAMFADVLVRFYTGEPNNFFGPVPIGLTAGTTAAPDNPMIDAVLAKPFPHAISKMNDTADPVALIRNALSAQVDQNATVVLAGPAVNLLALLALPGGKQLIDRKVKALTIAGKPAGAERLIAEWPTAVTTVPTNVGDAIPFPAASLEKDFAWSNAHPLVEAYRAYRPMPYDAPTTALAAALYAVHPQEKYFKATDKVLEIDAAQKDQVVAVYTAMASTKPVARPARFRPPQ